jgi:hypothetical protein
VRGNDSRTGKAQTPHGFYFIGNPGWLNKTSRLAKRTGISTQGRTQQIERFSYSLQVFRRRDLCPVHRDWIYQDQAGGRPNAKGTSIIVLQMQPSSPRVGLGRGKRKEKKRLAAAAELAA